jgi:hypothetical protein
MRLTVYSLMVITSFLAVPALAGTMNFTDGHGTWQPSQCQQPQPSASLSANPETAANDLNAQWAEYNAYAEAAQAYMNCLSTEAQRDATAASNTITQAAQSAIQQTQASVASMAARLRSRQPVLTVNP